MAKAMKAAKAAKKAAPKATSTVTNQTSSTDMPRKAAAKKAVVSKRQRARGY